MPAMNVMGSEKEIKLASSALTWNTHTHAYTHTVLVGLSRKYFLINEDYCGQNISFYGPTTKEVQALKSLLQICAWRNLGDY